MTTLLLGLGNAILTDDAVGVRLATDFAGRLADVPGLSVEPDCSVGGLNLLDVLSGYTRAIVLDSVKLRDGQPGRWHAFDAEALKETMHLTCVHDANFATALELGHRLGLPLPKARDVHVFAVEVDDVATFSERMTPALEERFSTLASEIFYEVERLLASPD